MKNFACIQEALDFASGNQHRLKFPFNCKCNGFPVRVLSPELARTIAHERPSLVATRTPSAGLELGYMVTAGTLKEILNNMAEPDVTYSLGICGNDAVVERAFPGSSAEFTFPVVKKVADVPTDDGTYILLKAPQQVKGGYEFWIPLETRLLRSAINPMA